MATNNALNLTLPAFDNISVQVFTANGTYTPTTGMKVCRVQLRGSGAAGGGTPTSGATSGTSGGGGGGGMYGEAWYTAATIGASKAVVIGSGGTGSTNAAGGNGATSTFGSTLLSVSGGLGGTVGLSQTFSTFEPGGIGGSTGSAASNIGTAVFNEGQPGGNGFYCTSWAAIGGLGGACGDGSGNHNIPAENGGSGSDGLSAPANSGAGGTGSSIQGTIGSVQKGGNGGSGICIITEYLSV